MPVGPYVTTYDGPRAPPSLFFPPVAEACRRPMKPDGERGERHHDVVWCVYYYSVVHSSPVLGFARAACLWPLPAQRSAAQRGWAVAALPPRLSSDGRGVRAACRWAGDRIVAIGRDGDQIRSDQDHIIPTGAGAYVSAITTATATATCVPAGTSTHTTGGRGPRTCTAGPAPGGPRLGGAAHTHTSPSACLRTMRRAL